MFVQMQAISK